jgi:hypothetical protein
LKETMTKTKRKPRRRIRPFITLDAQAVEAVKKALNWSAALASGPHDNQDGTNLVATLVGLRCELALSRIEQAERAPESTTDASTRRRSVKTRETSFVGH